MEVMELTETEKKHVRYLREQLITYIGNKRALLPYIRNEIEDIAKVNGKDKFVCCDLFAGSGVVSRLLKQYSSCIITNDLEDYAKVIADCYLTNEREFENTSYSYHFIELSRHLKELHPGIIAENYAPNDDKNIQQGERVFYTRRNAMFLDTAMEYIRNYISPEIQTFFIAPLLYEASVHVNTAGIFKGFYKNGNGVGQFGGKAKNCLDRICSDIVIEKPVLSPYDAEHISLQRDANAISKDLTNIDIAYLDPPYNQHPYGANYFMLNTILSQKVSPELSKVSGIPPDWKRSAYNKKAQALNQLENLIANLDSKYIIISYNDEGFIQREEMENMLSRHGSVKTTVIPYTAYRGSRNLNTRNIHVHEFLFVLQKANISRK